MQWYLARAREIVIAPLLLNDLHLVLTKFRVRWSWRFRVSPDVLSHTECSVILHLSLKLERTVSWRHLWSPHPSHTSRHTCWDPCLLETSLTLSPLLLHRLDKKFDDEDRDQQERADNGVSVARANRRRLFWCAVRVLQMCIIIYYTILGFHSVLFGHDPLWSFSRLYNVGFAISFILQFRLQLMLEML